MKKLIPLLIIGFFWLPVSAFGLEVPRLGGYVNDYAGMIQSATKAKLEEVLRGFEQSDSTQIVILTIPSLEGESIEEFGIRVAEGWKIGHQGKDNGVLLIVSRQDRKIRIEVGRGLEGRLTDLMAGRIIDQVIKPKFRQSDFDGGFMEGISALISATRGEFKAEPKSVSLNQGRFPPFLTFLLFLGIFVLILGSLSRILGGIAGAIGLPALVYLSVMPIGIAVILLLALIGLGAGLLLPSLFSAKGFGRSSYRGHRGGFFFGPGMGGHSIGGGGFSGGGGSFGGGGASGDW